MSGATPGLAVPYSARQQDLFYPAKDLSNFPTARPAADAELCAWMCLLAYCDTYLASFAFDQGTISAKLNALGGNPIGLGSRSNRHGARRGSHLSPRSEDATLKGWRYI